MTPAFGRTGTERILLYKKRYRALVNLIKPIIIEQIISYCIIAASATITTMGTRRCQHDEGSRSKI
jgi:hypothetical protein